MVKDRHSNIQSSKPAHHTALQQYRVRANQYDLELQPFEPLRLGAIERLNLQPGEVVLDVGCGTGLSFMPSHQRNTLPVPPPIKTAQRS